MGGAAALRRSPCGRSGVGEVSSAGGDKVRESAVSPTCTARGRSKVRRHPAGVVLHLLNDRPSRASDPAASLAIQIEVAAGGFSSCSPEALEKGERDGGGGCVRAIGKQR
jgi:hypothetical protein